MSNVAADDCYPYEIKYQLKAFSFGQKSKLHNLS